MRAPRGRSVLRSVSWGSERKQREGEAMADGGGEKSGQMRHLEAQGTSEELLTVAKGPTVRWVGQVRCELEGRWRWALDMGRLSERLMESSRRRLKVRMGLPGCSS